MIEIKKLKMTHLMTEEISMTREQLLELFLHTELLPFEEGIYKDGPTIFEFTPTQFDQSVQNCRIYIPVSAESESTDTLTYIPTLEVTGAQTRVRFEEGIDQHLHDLKAFVTNNDYELQDRLYMVMIPVFEDLFVDLIIPLED